MDMHVNSLNFNKNKTVLVILQLVGSSEHFNNLVQSKLVRMCAVNVNPSETVEHYF